MIASGQANAMDAPAEVAVRAADADDAPPVPAWTETRTPREICAEVGSKFLPPSPLDKVAVALNTLGQPPLNARRVTPERGICGWYIWGGKGGRQARAAGFFETLPVAHLLERCPQIMPFLALAPGWRVSLREAGPEILPPHDGAPPPNVAARRIGATTSCTPPVKQWVWFSIVLHILAVVLFGDTTSGERTGVSRGARAGGPLTVMLQRGTQDSAETLALRAETKLGSLEKNIAASEKSPAAPRTRTRRARPASDAAPVEAISPTPANATEVAPALPPVIATEVEKPVTDFVVPRAIPEPVKAPPPAPPEPPAARLPESLPKLETLPAPKAIVTPVAERDVALPPELIPRLAPLAPARNERVTPLETAPRAKTFVPPKIEPEPAPVPPPVTMPRMTPLAPLVPPTPASIERNNVRSPELLPRLPPVAPAASIETTKPTDVVPRVAQTVADPVAERTPAVEKTTAPPVATPTPTPATSPSNVAPQASSQTPTNAPPSPPASRTITGPTSGAGDSTLTPAPRAPLAGPPTAGAAPRIDLDAVRQRAREIGREGAGPRTLLPFNVKPKEDTRTKEQQAFDKALKRPDCRDAYAGMGLAAVVPLIVDSVSEKGCKW